MRYVATAFLILTSIATTAAQQTPATDTRVKSDNGTVVTMVGCLMIGGGTNFTLANIVSERDDERRETTRPHGPYALVAREGLDLGPFVNQKVEIAGVVVPPAAKGDRDDKIEIEETARVAGADGRDAKSRGKTTVKVARGPMHQFLVASAKPVAPNCES